MFLKGEGGFANRKEQSLLGKYRGHALITGPNFLRSEIVREKKKVEFFQNN